MRQFDKLFVQICYGLLDDGLFYFSFENKRVYIYKIDLKFIPISQI